MSARTPLSRHLLSDPEYDASLDPSAGTLIPSPFLPYTYAIVPYPFDSSNIFNRPMFFLPEYLIRNRPAIITSQKVVVEEMMKLREEEDRVKRLQDLPEFQVKLERDIDINDQRMWRKKLGWAKADDVALSEDICPLSTRMDADFKTLDGRKDTASTLLRIFAAWSLGISKSMHGYTGLENGDLLHLRLMSSSIEENTSVVSWKGLMG
jgi:hypothetical protein